MVGRYAAAGYQLESKAAVASDWGTTTFVSREQAKQFYGALIEELIIAQIRKKFDEEIAASETLLLLFQTTRRHIPEDRNPYEDQLLLVL
jgi:hypothetical protein